MRLYEVALTRAGDVHFPFPVDTDIFGDAGDYFFYPMGNPLNIDVILMADSKEGATRRAKVLMGNIETAGLWGDDYSIAKIARGLAAAKGKEEENLSTTPSITPRRGSGQAESTENTEKRERR